LPEFVEQNWVLALGMTGKSGSRFPWGMTDKKNKGKDDSRFSSE
jgi:hypothetical protein